MLQAIFKAISPTLYERSVQKKKTNADRCTRLDIAQQRFDTATKKQASVCVAVDKKLTCSIKVTNIARKLLGSEFVCRRLSHYDRHCSGCPWDGDCPLFEATQTARTKESL